MRSARTLSRGLAVLAAGLFSVSLVAALAHTPTEQPTPEPRAEAAKPLPVVPLLAKTAPANNPTELVLLPDETGVRGWIAGAKSYAGAKVSAKAGKAEHTATVRDDNTFMVPLTSTKAQAVEVSVSAPQAKALTGRTSVPAKADTNRRVAFVIADRSAYRPGHTLKFAAYVHDTRDGIAFKPVPNTEFTVDVTSETRGTRAARLKLRSDGEGRIAGQYTFTDADSLDHYQIAIQGAEPSGFARVFLGEYRKTKVGVKLKGEVKDGKLVLTFDARDYLDRPIKGTSATWSATVTKEADVAKLALDPQAFVAHEGGPPSVDDFNALPDDERLLTLAHGVSASSFAGFGARTVATREGKTAFGPNDAPTVTLDLWPEWTKGQHTVTVSGTFLDETGRENRATGTFSLTPAGAKAVRVSAPKELYTTGEKVAVSLTSVGLDAKDAPNTTLLLVRLESNPASPWITPQFNYGEVDPDDPDPSLPDNTRLPALGAPAKKPVAAPEAQSWKAQPVFDPVKRAITSVVPVTNNAAEVTLRQAGAYKLLAVTRLADGTTLQHETGIVCRAPAKLPGLALQLDARELPAGGRLSGTVHTRFAGAKLLLVLRDAGGAKFTKALTAGENGVARFDEALPPNLSYGCAVTAHYVEAAATVHSDMREVFVIPTDRTLTVTTSTPDTVGPGAEVKLNFAVNRQEEVDLVVSVFDESLMGVSGDLSKAIRDFYLGDARGHNRGARDLTAARFGGVTVADLVKKGDELLKDQQALAREPALKPQLTALSENWRKGELTPPDVVALVRLAGFEVHLAQYFHPNMRVTWKVPKGARLADLLRRDGLGSGDGEDNDKVRFYLSATVIDNVVLLGLADRSGLDPWAMHRGNFGFGGQFGAMRGFSCNGFGSHPGFSGWGFGGPRYGFGGAFAGGFGGGGFGGGALGGAPLGNGLPPSVAGFQGSFSHPGGNMGFSTPFAGMGPVGGALNAGGPLPGLGISDGTVRRDFADSAFWSANLRTDKTGKATATFKVPDSLTNWRVQVVAVSPKLHVGTATTKFKTSRPVMIWPMLPRAFAEGDTVSVFGTVHNLTDQEQNVRVRMTAENGSVLSEPERTVKVPANGSVPVYWQYRAGKPGFTDLLMSAKCDAGEDASLKKLPVVPSTVIERVTASGLIDKGELKVELPQGFDPKRASVSVTVAPTLAADLADTLPYLVEYPYGCVEQTMSRFLPALRVAAILKQSGISTVKELEAKMPKVVEAGQKRLIELQQPDGGWGWNGNSQTHEMMTPYALFGLLAAEDAGYPCPNPNTIDRGLTRQVQYLNQMGGAWDAALANNTGTSVANDALFCLWVFAIDMKRYEQGGIETDKWFARIEKSAGTHLMSDSGHAFALELAVKFKKKELAEKLAGELRKRAQKSGDRVFWTKAGFSRWGDNTIEVTATVMKALVAHDPKDALIPGAIAYFHSTKRGDRWDSTKDTAHVLYALCDYLAATQAGPAAAGEVSVALNGTDLGAVKLDGAASKVLKANGATLKPGANTFKLSGPKVSGGALVRVSVSFTRTDGARTPARDHGVKVERTVSVREANGEWRALKSGDAVPVGSYLKVRVTAVPTANDLRYFLIESPKPASGETIPATDSRFAPPADATRHVLREERESMTCYHYEQANAAVAEYVVLTEFEGTFALAPARGELMYQPQSGGHSDSFALVVTPKK
jgi:hypothetical protein